MLDSPKRLINEFRCWPIDIDIFFHMNNAKYLTVAEMARWRMMFSMGSRELLAKRCTFFVTEQNITYLKAIQPLQKYTVETKVEYNPVDNKWLWYTHTFLQHPSSIKNGQDPVIYAVVSAKVCLYMF
jgi:acyl-CoA thioesterase FadM